MDTIYLHIANRTLPPPIDRSSPIGRALPCTPEMPAVYLLLAWRLAMRWMIRGARLWKTPSSLITVMVLWAVTCGAWATQSAGTVKTLTGSATVTRDSSTLTAALGQRVYPGDRILVSGGSYVGVTLHDDTLLTIGPGSEVLIREFEFNPSSHAGGLAISFLKGTARVITGILAKNGPDRVKFNTPTATIGIRGTDFIVDLEERE